MPPNPDELFASVRLVKAVEQNILPSPTMRGSHRSPQVTLSPYSKTTPEWESPRRIKVNDIVAHFEHLNKKKDIDDSSNSRNDSRSSGIVSDFEEDHDQSLNTFSKSFTPIQSSRSRDDEAEATAFKTSTPIPFPRTSFSTSFPSTSTLMEEEASDNEEEDEIFIPEVEYMVEEMNSNDNDYEYESKTSTLADFLKKLLTKLFSLSVLLYVAFGGCYGAFLLGERSVVFVSNLKNLSPSDVFHQDEVPCLVLVTTITIQFMGWYFIFRKSFWDSSSTKISAGLMTNALLVLFQPALFLTSGGSNDHDAYQDKTRNRRGHRFLITLWLSLLQIAFVATPITFPEYIPGLNMDKMSTFESILIFGTLPQLTILLLMWPLLAFFSRKSGYKSKIE